VGSFCLLYKNYLFFSR